MVAPKVIILNPGKFDLTAEQLQFLLDGIVLMVARGIMNRASAISYIMRLGITHDQGEWLDNELAKRER